MKLAQLYEAGHWGVWANHPGGLGGASKKNKKKNKHPGVPEHDTWQQSFEKKTKEIKTLDGSTGRPKRKKKK